MSSGQSRAAPDHSHVHTINVATDFSRSPGGRSPRNGAFSGQEFREKLLAPALRGAHERNNKVVVNLDGTDTYIGSFLEEAFGGLLRHHFTHLSELEEILEIRATGEFAVFRDLALEYMRDEDSKRQARG